MRNFAFALLLLICGPVFADDCVDVDRTGWPEKFKTRSLAGAVSMIAAEDGIDAALNPGVNGGQVYQAGYGRVCVKLKNPAFDMRKVTSAALLQKMIENEALNEAAEAEIKAKAKAFDLLSENEKLELIREKLNGK